MVGCVLVVGLNLGTHSTRTDLSQNDQKTKVWRRTVHDHLSNMVDAVLWHGH